jgi:protease-4
MGEDFLFATAGSESFQQLLTRLKKAKDDDQVKALVFLGNSTALGQAQVEEVRKVMDEIKAADKRIYVHAESMSMRTYVLYSAASRISVVPNGDLWLTGLYGESLHVRGLLDKIGVMPDFLTCGEYKSAGEMFTHKRPSPEANDNINWLFDGMFDAYVDLTATGRGTSPETVRQWIDKGLYSAAEAKQRKIVDEVEYRSDFLATLKSKYGEKVKFDKRYAKKKQADIDFSSPLGIFKFYADLFAGPTRVKTGKDSVAIVYVEGPIVAGKPDPNAFPFGSQGIAFSTPIRRALDKAAEDESIKAVVLRVNSPGGSAVGSEVILQATRRVAEKKPFVVSMGDVAGSGGYYVACGTDTIFADPTTITASIGVVAGKLVTHGMWDKIGINWEPYERGENAGLLSSAEPFTDQERQVLQTWMDEIYEVFKGHIIDIRGDRLKKDLEDMAGGRVYTGRQALELGLVDQLGGLGDAIQHVAKKAELEDYEIRVVPRPKSLADLLRQSLTGEEDDDEQTLSLSKSQLGLNANTTVTDLALPYLKGIEPTRLKSIQDALRQLETLQGEQVSLPMPIISFGNR